MYFLISRINKIFREFTDIVLEDSPKGKMPSVSHTFSDIYRLTKEVLGTGAHSSVTTCIHRSTGKEFAVKVVPKRSSTDREKVLREVEILYLCRENR